MSHRIDPKITSLLRICPFAIAVTIIVAVLLSGGTSASAQQPSPTSTPESDTITASDVDGYHSAYSVVIFVSSIGTNLTMRRTNTYTSERNYVKLRADGTLTTGIGGTVDSVPVRIVYCRIDYSAIQTEPLPSRSVFQLVSLSVPSTGSGRTGSVRSPITEESWVEDAAD